MKQNRELCPGCASEAESIRCARCRATVCVWCSRQAFCPLCAFDVVQEVLVGKRVPAGPGDAKLTHLFLDFPASDIRIDARGIERRRLRASQPDRYYRDSGPIAVGHLMDRAGLTRVTEPIVATIRSAPIWLVQDPAGRGPMKGSAWSTEAPPTGWSSIKQTPSDHCGWFIPGPDALHILLRAQPELPPAPQPIPTGGPFAAVPLPPWSPEPPRFRDENPPRPCPHCQQSATRFREIGDSLICLTCSRSFPL